MIDRKALKLELQGSQGLISVLRKKYIPSTIEMAHLAQVKYEESKPSYADIDESLEKLLEIEFKIYKEKMNEFYSCFIEYLDSEAKSPQHLVTRFLLDSYKKQEISSLRAANYITEIMLVLAESNRQSGVTRAGASLMNHIAFLLEKRGFIFERHFEREFYLDPLIPSSKLDFFFPSREMFQHEPKNCCAASCQTTSNDRYRLTFAQAPKGTRNRACTAIGSKNFGEKLGPKSLTDNKLKSARSEGIKFVILNSAIDDRLKNSNAVTTYEEWFEELQKLKSFWN